MSKVASSMKFKGLFLIVFFLLSSVGLAAMVFSSSSPDESRSVHPPGAPVNPTPANNAKGLVGDTVNLLWAQQLMYRGDHKEIDQNWVKVSTEGPVYSDQAQANIYNGAVAGTSLSIPLEMGKTYYWAVKSHDEDGWGPYSDWKFYTNSYPVGEILTVRPNPARQGVEVEFKGKGEDPVDGDAIVQYEWKSSIDHIISDEKIFKVSDLTTGSHEISFRVKDSKGLWSLENEDSVITLKVTENSDPTEPGQIKPKETHSLTPDISWYPSTDEEDDDITYYLTIGTTYHGSDIASVSTTQAFYYLNNQPLKYSTQYSGGKSENVYFLEIYADDGFSGTSRTVEHRFTVVNHQPLEPVLSISPDNPTITQNLELEITEKSKDPDGENVKETIEWYLGDKIKKEYSNKYVIPKSKLEAGQRWEARVTPNDGIVDGIVGIYSVEIQNTAPEVTISHPREGLVIDTATELLLDASNTTDVDLKDGPKLSFFWKSDRDGDLQTGEKVYHKGGLSLGDHTITVTASDGINTVKKTVTIYVEEVKFPKIDARILPIGNGKLYIDEQVDITVQVKNLGAGVATNVEVILYNNRIKPKENEMEDAEKIKEWKIPELGVNSYRNLSYVWTVQSIANLKVQVNGKDVHSRPFEPVTGEVGSNDAPQQLTPEVRPTETGSGGIDTWMWVVIAVIVVIFIGGIGVFIFYKMSSYEGDDFDEEPVGYGTQTPYGGYSDPYAQQLQQQLTALQNIITTYMPQYSSYAYGQGAYPALPPSSVGGGSLPMAQRALPPGPQQFQTYTPPPFYNPFQTQVSQAPLALPPAPSDATAGRQVTPGEPEHTGYPPFAAYSPYSVPGAPSPGAFSPAQPEYALGPETGKGGYGFPYASPPYSTGGAALDKSPLVQYGTASSVPSPVTPPSPFAAPSPQGYIFRRDVDGVMEDRLAVLDKYESDDGLPVTKTEHAKPVIITPKETVLCHICRAPITVTSKERPFVTVCDSCGAAVEVS
ncbi:MAG: hypothetical protein QF682_11320 [Candidatus Thermoplasmatota archaeon]|nr:hypothetical protein [Candidatus Thermoplasmatota archaeon]